MKPITLSSDRFPQPIHSTDPSKVKSIAAVAILIIEDSILMIKRAIKDGDPWSGHMAFPGGRFEQQDSDLRKTAERETFEEIGIELIPSSFVGPLTPLNHPRLSVHAYVYQLEKRPVMKPNEEVAEIHWLTFEELTVPKYRSHFPHEYRGELINFPSIQIRNVTIWGITFQFICDLLSRLEYET